MYRSLILACLALCATTASLPQRLAHAQTRVFGTEFLSGPPDGQLITQPSLLDCDLPRNLGAVHPPKTPVILPVAHYGTSNFLVRPWYVAPYRYYSYYRPWYTFGRYGPTYHRYHYAPSWGYAPLPFYAPPYLSPAGYQPPDYTGCYYW